MSDTETVAAAVISARQVAGRPIVYVTVIPRQAGLPSVEARKAMEANMHIMAAHCEVLYAAIEGSDLKRSLLRGLLRTLAVMARAPVRVHWCTTLEQALDGASSHAPGDVANVRATLAHQHGKPAPSPTRG